MIALSWLAVIIIQIMKVLVYGGGSVGLGIASCLLKSRAYIDIIAREQTTSVLKAEGLIRKGIFGDYYERPDVFGSFCSLNEIINKTYDYILVCTKSFDSLYAAEDLSQKKDIFADTTVIVLFQNGWGNAEIFTRFFKKRQIYNARVITGFRRPRLNEVAVTVHADAIHIGSLFGSDLSRIKELCELISKGDIPCEITNDIDKDIWAKMLYNCALNPLSAILDVPYGALAANESTKMLMNGIIEELFEVIIAAGYKTHWKNPNDFLDAFYRKLVPDTAEHKSSTLQDILARKKTEIDALNGAVIKLAKEYQIDVPYNLMVYNIIKFLEAKDQT